MYLHSAFMSLCDARIPSVVNWDDSVAMFSDKLEAAKDFFNEMDKDGSQDCFPQRSPMTPVLLPIAVGIQLPRGESRGTK